MLLTYSVEIYQMHSSDNVVFRVSVYYTGVLFFVPPCSVLLCCILCPPW